MVSRVCRLVAVTWAEDLGANLAERMETEPEKKTAKPALAAAKVAAAVAVLSAVASVAHCVGRLAETASSVIPAAQSDRAAETLEVLVRLGSAADADQGAPELRGGSDLAEPAVAVAVAAAADAE